MASEQHTLPFWSGSWSAGRKSSAACSSANESKARGRTRKCRECGALEAKRGRFAVVEARERRQGQFRDLDCGGRALLVGSGRRIGRQRRIRTSVFRAAEASQPESGGCRGGRLFKPFRWREAPREQTAEQAPPALDTLELLEVRITLAGKSLPALSGRRRAGKAQALEPGAGSEPPPYRRASLLC